MQIEEAIKRLNEAVGIACGATGPGASPNAPQALGDDISKSVVDFRPSSQIPEDSIPLFDPNAPQERIAGGSVMIRFSGAQQPEAARTLDSILAPIIDSVTSRNQSQYRARVGFTTQRVMDFFIPDHVAGDFVKQVGEVTALIERNPQLQEQFRRATEASVEQINDIPGAKPYVHLVLGKGFQEKGTEPGIEPPHFNLLIAGVPPPLARKLAEATGQDFNTFPDSKPTSNREHTRRFNNGGKTVSIAMNDPRAADAIETIKAYVQAMRRVNRPESGDGLPPRGG